MVGILDCGDKKIGVQSKDEEKWNKEQFENVRKVDESESKPKWGCANACSHAGQV